MLDKTFELENFPTLAIWENWTQNKNDFRKGKQQKTPTPTFQKLLILNTKTPPTIELHFTTLMFTTGHRL